MVSNHSMEDDRLDLEALIVDDQEFKQLETLLEQFNIFEAIGAIDVELRHSDFLAFLLNPNQNHGLGDSFVKELLQKASSQSSENILSITPIELDIWDLDEMIVLREWQKIDILLLDEANQFIVIIENKIKSSEHSDQLRRYHKIAKQHYPDFRILPLFLTPEGDEPSEPEYLAISYNTISDLIESIIEVRGSTLGPDVLTLITHYRQMLRRHIVSKSEITELCKSIYRKHQHALDLIYEYRPDQQEDIRKILETIIDDSSKIFTLDHSTKSQIRFCPKEWDTSILLQGETWTLSGRILLFEFSNSSDRLNLNLIIGPGPEETRKRLFEMAKNQGPPFKPAFKALGKKFNTIYQFSFLTSKSYEDTATDDLEVEIHNKWSQFLEHEFPIVRNFLKEQDWIWENPQ